MTGERLSRLRGDEKKKPCDEQEMWDVHGFLNILKPEGITSFQAVARVRSLVDSKRVGHAGTLDSPATGVLPVALGQANRLIEYLHDMPKVYRATVELGVTTDTYDAAGAVVSRADPRGIALQQVREALDKFVGSILQAPPPYSAVHFQGKRLHTLARAGLEVSVAPRRVHIYRVDIVSWDFPIVVLEVECGKGTYVRSIAHDLGKELGCGGHLKKLERTRYGPFWLEESVNLDELAMACAEGVWHKLLYAEDEVLLSWDAMILGEIKEKAVRQGQRVDWNGTEDGERCRAYNIQGYLVGVLRHESGLWRPEKVLSLTPPSVG